MRIRKTSGASYGGYKVETFAEMPLRSSVYKPRFLLKY